MDVFADKLQGLWCRGGDVAGDLAEGEYARAEAEGGGVGVAGLLGELDQSMVRPSRRGGVPVLRRQPRRPRRLRDSPRRTEAGSPERPAVYCCSPQWMRPLRKVPVVMMVAVAQDGAAVAEHQAQATAVRRATAGEADSSASLRNDTQGIW